MGKLEAAHELEQQRTRELIYSPKVKSFTKADLEAMGQEAQEAFSKTLPANFQTLEQKQAEQRRKDEKYLMFRGAQIAKEFEKDLNLASPIEQAKKIVAVTLEMRKHANEVKNGNKQKP